MPNPRASETINYVEGLIDQLQVLLRHLRTGHIIMPKTELILYQVALYTGVAVDEILDMSRQKPLPDIRCMIARELKDAGFKTTEVSRILNRHHSTVINMLNRHRHLYQYDEKFRTEYDLLHQHLIDLNYGN